MTSERKFIEENVKRVLLKEYLKRKTERSGFGGLDIQRTPMGTRVTLIAERPGMVIGRKGETIKELTEYVENVFKFDNPQIEVKEVTNPNLNPHIMAQKLANALERGWHFRRAGHSTVRRIMSAGAKGCQVIISGKLTGQRHRTEKFREGHIKYCGETKLNWMHEGYAVAKKKLGVIGVKVQIMDPNAKLPDDIELLELKDVVEIKTVTAEAEVEIEQNVEIDIEKTEKKIEVEGEVEGEVEVKLEEAETGKETEMIESAKPTEPEPKMEPETIEPAPKRLNQPNPLNRNQKWNPNPL
jgi:small subunit ribosomal protein S3